MSSIPQSTPKYGSRTYAMNDGVVVVKQTRFSAGRYVVDADQQGNQRERHLDPGPGQEQQIGEAVIAAHQGTL